MRLVTALCLLMTSVSAAQSGPLRFAIYGDWGVGPNFVPTDPTLSTATLPGTIWKQANLTVPQFGHLYSLTEQAVVSQFQNVSDVYQPQFIISTGDQFYDDGLFTRDDPQFQSKFTSVYTSSGVNVTWYPCLGNHDYYQNPTAELNRTADDWRWYFPSKYYNFSYFLEDGSEVLFVVMDVTPALQKYRKEAGISNPTAKYYHKQMVQLLQAERAAGTWAVQLAWAEQVLTFSRAPWKFVVAHEPVYTSNSLTNEFAELQTDLQPILERTGVSAVFSGHFHTLDISENNNIAYIISGAASQVPYPIGNGTAAALIEYFATVNVTAKVDYGSATPIPSNGTTRYPTEGPLPAVKPVQTPIFTGGNELELPGFMNARLNNTHLHIDIWGLTNDEKWSIVKTYDTLRVDLKPKKQIGPLKFNIIGDWGVGPNFVASNKDDYGSIHVAANLTLQQYGQLLSMTEQAVDTQFKMVSDSFYPQFVISTGDQFYDDGLWTRTDPQFVNKFTRTYNSVGVQVPWYPCLGNHDYYQDPTTELNRTIDDWRWNFPAKYYNFSKYLEDGSEVLFVVMDVNPDLVKYRMEKDIQPGGKYYHKNIVQLLQAAKSTWATQLAWADKVLNSSTAKWKIVVGHEPIYSATGDNSFSELQRDVQPILERNNVTAYLSGHYHTLELVETNMVQYIISGAASQVPYPIGNGTVAGLLDYFNMNPVNTTLPPPSTQVPNVTLSNGTAYPVEAKPPNGVPAQIAYFVGGKEKWLPGFMTATFVNSSVLHIDVYGMGNDTTWSVVARHDILRRDLRVAAPTQTPSTTQPPTTTPTGSTGNNTTPTPGMATTVPPTSTPTTSSNSSSTGMTSSSSSSTGSVYSNGYMVKSSVWMCMMIMIIIRISLIDYISISFIHSPPPSNEIPQC